MFGWFSENKSDSPPQEANKMMSRSMRGVPSFPSYKDDLMLYSLENTRNVAYDFYSLMPCHALCIMYDLADTLYNSAAEGDFPLN